MIHVEPVAISDDLVRAARQGSQTAKSELWDLCEPIVRIAIVRAVGRHSDEAPDVIQEAALVLFGILHEGEQESGHEPGLPANSFAQKFQRLVQFRIRTYVRAERRRAARTVSTSFPSVEIALDRRSSGRPPATAGRSIDRALERLSPRQRAVVAAIYFKDDKVRSIAGELRISPQAVTALHRRALSVLRDALKE